MQNPRFDDFEEDVMKRLLAGDDEILIKLRGQYEVATIHSRDFTGAGFFTHFRLAGKSLRLDRRNSFHFGDVIGQKDGSTDDAVGFVLFVKDGILDYLEGYTFGAETWPEDLKDYRLSYSTGVKRDMNKVRANWSEFQAP